MGLSQLWRHLWPRQGSHVHQQVLHEQLSCLNLSEFRRRFVDAMHPQEHWIKNPAKVFKWSLGNLYTTIILFVKNTTFRCVFSHVLPVPFGHLITVPSTADNLHFQLYFWKKNHIIQTVVRTLKPV